MGFQDAMNYVLFTNPISVGTQYVVWGATGKVLNAIGLGSNVRPNMPPPVPLWKLAATSGPYVRLAALSGAAAVIIGAYGSHRKYRDDHDKQIFETASRYHFIHTLALLGLPLCRTPFLAASLMMSGMLLFCGSCYYSSFTGDKRYNAVTPFGGVCFIFGWLTMAI